MSIELDKISKDGKASGKVAVSESVFGIEPNTHVIQLSVRRAEANKRAGTASAKTRSEVRGGGKKPWKQKGTGRARAGSTRSPLWAGGGVIFGPKPRDYAFKLPKKMRRLALRSALSGVSKEIKVIDDFSFLSAPKTKEAMNFLLAANVATQKVLILADHRSEENKHLFLSMRNIPNVTLRLPSNLSVRDLLNADVIIATDAAIKDINERYSNDGA